MVAARSSWSRRSRGLVFAQPSRPEKNTVSQKAVGFADQPHAGTKLLFLFLLALLCRWPFPICSASNPSTGYRRICNPSRAHRRKEVISERHHWDGKKGADYCATGTGRTLGPRVSETRHRSRSQKRETISKKKAKKDTKNSHVSKGGPELAQGPRWKGFLTSAKV